MKYLRVSPDHGVAKQLIKKNGSIKKFPFAVKSHIEIGSKQKKIDLKNFIRLHKEQKDFDNNLSCLIGVLESVRKARCKLIFPSTASVYDSSNGLPLNEQDYVKPTSPYAAAKVAGEFDGTGFGRT